jgi:FkbM family methyltransferase
MKLLSAAIYYARSSITLLTGVAEPLLVARRLLPGRRARPSIVHLRASGWRFWVRSAMDVWIIKETILDRDYLWATSLQPDWIVVDIGAGLGDFSVLAAKECPQGFVHAYEPLASSYALLQENLALNELGNVQTFPQGVAAGASYLSAGDADVPAVSTRFAARPGPAAVAAVDLAAVLDRLPGGRCDFMKIDCEGCEFELLLHSPASVLARVSRLSLETHEGYTDHTAAELVTWLRRQGFTVRRRPNPVHRALGLLYAERVLEIRGN